MKDTLEPEFPQPTEGDELILVTYGRHASQTPVRVVKMARFRLEVEGVEEALPWNRKEWDIRTRGAWDSRYESRAYRARNPRLHTPETLAWESREIAADAYLKEMELHVFHLRGSLCKAARADLIGFANALRRFEGLEEI